MKKILNNQVKENIKPLIELSAEEKRKYDAAYIQAIDLLKSLLSSDKSSTPGFRASSINKDNYNRLFTRDTFWIGMASLLANDSTLIDGFKISLEVLRNYQREDGAIPSNVSSNGSCSFGIINIRIDPTSFYIIGCIEYFRFTHDRKMIEKFYPSIKKALSFLEKNWVNKYCGLLYIPRAGNWADEYFQQGFVLYDETLWYTILLDYAYILGIYNKKEKNEYLKRAKQVKLLIKNQFWINNAFRKKDTVFKNVNKKFNLDYVGYFIHFFYNKKNSAKCFLNSNAIFDGFGNCLALLLDIPSISQSEKIIRFIDEIAKNKYPLIPAHYPFFDEDLFRSKKLHQFRFKQHIGHYHNGGLWPWYTGLYITSMAKRGYYAIALKFLKGIYQANNAVKKDGNFYEYHIGRKATAKLIFVHEKKNYFYFTRILNDFISRQIPMIQFTQGNLTLIINNIMDIRTFNFTKKDIVTVTVTGPYAEHVLSALSLLRDKKGNRYFEDTEVKNIKSKPKGTPFLGVSAAAYIIGYKAVFEKKYILSN